MADLSMELPKQTRLKVWTPFLFALIMVLGMSLGYKLHDTLRNKRDLQNVVERNDRLESIIDLINERYVDTINTNALYRDAVKGILSHLDPHTIYIPADQLADVNEGLQGSFYGIGVEYAVIHDTLEITAVVPGGPAEKEGVEPGDKLISISDTVVAGNGTTTSRIVSMLRGEQNTKVRASFRKVANGPVRTVEIVRDEVPLYSIDAALMLDRQTGYIKINRFSATTYEEFAKALRKLKNEGLKQLVVDVRDNPGGYLDAATNIVDELLDGERPIVSTQGRQSEKVVYKTDKAGLFEQGRLAILVDENSASASEILAGAIQDWDRGVLIGRRTYGKGLVQEQYDLDDGSALRLTIAHYYTPSGRSIQRSYDQGRDAYEAAFTERYKSGELTGNDSLVREDSTTYYTSHHRIVRGGGGIKPDVYVPYDSGRLSPGLLNILISNELQAVIYDYYNAHFTQLKQYRTAADLNRLFDGSKDILADYIRQLTPAARDVANAVLARKANKDFLLLQIKAQVARILFRNNGYYAVSSGGDDVLQRALEVLNSNAYSEIIGR